MAAAPADPAGGRAVTGDALASGGFLRSSRDAAACCEERQPWIGVALASFTAALYGSEYLDLRCGESLVVTRRAAPPNEGWAYGIRLRDDESEDAPSVGWFPFEYCRPTALASSLSCSALARTADGDGVACGACSLPSPTTAGLAPLQSQSQLKSGSSAASSNVPVSTSMHVGGSSSSSAPAPAEKTEAERDASVNARSVGSVRDWCKYRKFGYLEPTGLEHDNWPSNVPEGLFVHIKAFKHFVPNCELFQGDRVEFVMGSNGKGRCASSCVKLSLPGPTSSHRVCRSDISHMHRAEPSEPSDSSLKEVERWRQECLLLSQTNQASGEGSCLGSATAKHFAAAAQELAQNQLRHEVLSADLASHHQASRFRLGGEQDQSSIDDVVSSYLAALGTALDFPRSQAIDAKTVQFLHSKIRGVRGGVPGSWRSNGARAGLSIFLPAEKVPDAMQAFCKYLRIIADSPSRSAPAKAAWVLYWFTAIHPFSDGNGRVGRILMNWMLKRCGVPFVCHLCTSAEHRDEYIAASKEAHLCGGRNLHRLANAIASALHRCFRQLHCIIDRLRDAAAESEGDATVRRWREGRQQEPCLICLDDNPDMTTLCCGQAMHLGCLYRVLLTGENSRCPYCRKEIARPTPVVQAPNSEWSTSSAFGATTTTTRVVDNFVWREDTDSDTTTVFSQDDGASDGGYSGYSVQSSWGGDDANWTRFAAPGAGDWYDYQYERDREDAWSEWQPVHGSTAQRYFTAARNGSEEDEGDVGIWF